MKMSPLMPFWGDGKIASSDRTSCCGMWLRLAPSQAPQMYRGRTFWRRYSSDPLAGGASSAATASQALTPAQSPFARK